MGAHDNSAAKIENRHDIHEACSPVADHLVYFKGLRGKMSSVVGWDIGGVHLKAARADNGRIVEALQIASPLRSGLEPLIRAFAQAKAELGGVERHVVTMTGELADTFSSRPEGVERLAMLAARELAGAAVSIYAGPAGYVSPERARAHAGEIASANWHACAALVARHRRNALFLDMGSTTTDVVPVIGGEIAARGYTDVQRLAAGELVYTGLVRGFVMATADRAPFNGIWTPLINENFANMADVHRILGALPADADQMATADGREKTPAASRARLARMIGADAADADSASWLALARWFAEMQMRAIVDAVMLASSHCEPPPDAPMVGAGVGTQVIQEIARRVGRSYVGFDELLQVTPQARTGASRCAPAAALALLCS